MSKDHIPSEEFTEQDADMLLKHYGRPPENLKAIMQSLEQERDAFIKRRKQQHRLNTKTRDQGHDRKL